MKFFFFKERVEKQHQHLPKLHPKDSAELGPKKPKKLFSKDQWANKCAALLATLGTQSKEIGLFIITVYQTFDLSYNAYNSPRNNDT